MNDYWVFNCQNVPSHKGLYNIIADLLFIFLWKIWNKLQEGLQRYYIFEILSPLNNLA